VMDRREVHCHMDQELLCSRALQLQKQARAARREAIKMKAS
jgi:hypothetical protein